MGYNTSVIVLNDALDAIARDPDFGKKLSYAVMAAASPPTHRSRIDLDVSASNHCNAASVIETHHADQTSLVSFGGNMGHVHLISWGWLHHQEAKQVEMFKDWANKLGYRVVKIGLKPAQLT